MAERPKVNLTLTITDKLINKLAWVVFTATWLLPLIMLQNLPEIIPSHFNGDGKVDGYSGKFSVLILPAVCTFVFLLLHVVGMHPDKLNYPVTITGENAEKQYRSATRVLRTLKLTVSLLFLLIETEVIFPWVREHVGLWIPGIGIFMIAAPVSYQIFSSMRNK
jgi:uncharacterized membrane protein